MNTLVCVAAFLVVAQIPADLRDRDRHPLAPSLPRLTKEEYAKIDTIIDRFIQYDIGKLKGDEGKKALEDFNQLGPEAIFNLIGGLNRAANMEHSCPAVIIAKKVAKVLSTTDDMELLMFAKENIGADVKAKRHVNVLHELQATVLFRKGTLQRRAMAGGGKAPSTMSLTDLEKGVSKERGAKLNTLLAETEKRQGAKAVDILLIGVTNNDAAVAKLSKGLLVKNLQHQSKDVLKTMLKHERKEVRFAAAQAVGAKKLRLGGELIALLQDGEDDVRQAARRALVRIADGADYGPESDADSSQRQAAVEAWRAWWGRQK